MLSLSAATAAPVQSREYALSHHVCHMCFLQTNTYAEIFSGPPNSVAISSHMSTPEPGEVDIPPPLSQHAKAIANALLKPGDAKYVMTDLVGGDAVNHLPNVTVPGLSSNLSRGLPAGSPLVSIHLLELEMS